VTLADDIRAVRAHLIERGHSHWYPVDYDGRISLGHAIGLVAGDAQSRRADEICKVLIAEMPVFYRKRLATYGYLDVISMFNYLEYTGQADLNCVMILLDTVIEKTE